MFLSPTDSEAWIVNLTITTPGLICMETVNLSLLPRVAKSTTVSNVLIRRSPRGRTRVCGRPGSKWAMTRATGDESGLSVGADEVQQGGIGPAVRQGVKDARESLRWGNATVTENRSEARISG